MSVEQSIPGRRVCLCCKEPFPLTKEYFNRKKRDKSGFQSICRTCHKLKEHERRQRPDVQAKERARKSQPEYKAAAIERDRQRRASETYQQTKQTSEFKASQLERANRRRTRLITTPNDVTDEQKEQSLRYWGNRCAVCGVDAHERGLIFDHWIPLSKGGTTTITNLVPLCTGRDSCNQSKYTRDAQEWLTWRYGASTAQEILSEVEAYFEHMNESWI